MGKVNHKEYMNMYNKKQSTKDKIKKSYEKNRTPRKGNIYIMSNPAWNDFIKVGRAKCTEARLVSYQTSSPYRDYCILFSIEVSDLIMVERFIYNKYETINEWLKADWK